MIQPVGDQEFAPAEDGTTLRTGDRVKTAGESYAVITFFEGSTIELEPETEVLIQQLQSADDPSVTPAIAMKQFLGTSWSRVVKLSDPANRYEIETPSALVLVRGTLVETRVQPDETTVVKTVEGQVAVVAQNVQVAIDPGTETTVEPGKPPTPPKASPPPTRTLRITLASAAWMRIVDPAGRSAGIVRPGIVVNQIPGSTDSDPFQEPQMLVVPEPPDGGYTIHLEGKERGSYHLSIEGLRGERLVFQERREGKIDNGQRLAAALTIQLTPGREAPAVLGPFSTVGGQTPGKTVIMKPVAERAAPTATALARSQKERETPEPTATPKPTGTTSPTRTPRPTATPEPTDTPEPTETPRPTRTPRPTATPEPTDTPEPGQTPRPTRTPRPTATPEPTDTPEPTRTARPTQTPRPTATPEPTDTPEPTRTARPTQTPRPTATPRPLWTPTPTESPTPSPTPRETPTESP